VKDPYLETNLLIRQSAIRSAKVAGDLHLFGHKARPIVTSVRIRARYDDLQGEVERRRKEAERDQHVNGLSPASIRRRLPLNKYQPVLTRSSGGKGHFNQEPMQTMHKASCSRSPSRNLFGTMATHHVEDFGDNFVFRLCHKSQRSCTAICS
jgi:hypothetical protein